MGGIGRVARAIGAVENVATKVLDKTGFLGQVGKIGGSILAMLPGAGSAAGLVGKALGSLGGDVGKTKQWLAEGLAAFNPMQQSRRLGEQVISLPTEPFQPLGGFGGGATAGGAIGKQVHALMGEILSRADSLQASLDLLQGARKQPGLLLPASGGPIGGAQQQLGDVAGMLQELLKQAEPPRPLGQAVIR